MFLEVSGVLPLRSIISVLRNYLTVALINYTFKDHFHRWPTFCGNNLGRTAGQAARGLINVLPLCLRLDATHRGQIASALSSETWPRRRETRSSAARSIASCDGPNLEGAGFILKWYASATPGVRVSQQTSCKDVFLVEKHIKSV